MSRFRAPRHTRHRSLPTITSTSARALLFAFADDLCHFTCSTGYYRWRYRRDICCLHSRTRPLPSLFSKAPSLTYSPLLSLSNHTLSSASHYSQSQSSNPQIPPSTHDYLLDFPDLNLPGDPSSPAEQLTSRPDVANAISRIISAASQLAVVVRPPLLTICDASMIVRSLSVFNFFYDHELPFCD